MTKAEPPFSPERVQVNIRMTHELRDRIRLSADRDARSFNQQALWLLRLGLKAIEDGGTE